MKKNKYLFTFLSLVLISMVAIEHSFAAAINDVLEEGETILNQILTWVKYFVRIACTLAFIWNLYNYGKNNAPWESTLKWIMVILAIAASTEVIAYLFDKFDQ
jgi:hypothetical protein